MKSQFELHPDKSIAGLADALGLEPPAVSKILSGVRQIKATEYVVMRGFFGLPNDGERARNAQDGTYIVDPLTSPDGFNEDTNAANDDAWVMPAHMMQRHTDATPENVRSFEVGDSMMAPDFKRGEHVLVDLSDTTPSPPGTFVVSDGFGFLLRNIEYVPKSNPPQIKISALEPKFQTQKLHASDFDIIGRVIAKLQWL